MDHLHEFVSIETRNRHMNAARFKVGGEIEKEIFADVLDQDLDLPGATKPPACVESHDCGLAGLQNVARTKGQFVFETTGAERTNRCSLFVDQHARTWASITRSLNAYESSERKRRAAAFFPFPNDIVSVFHINLSGVIGRSRTRLPVA